MDAVRPPGCNCLNVPLRTHTRSSHLFAITFPNGSYYSDTLTVDVQVKIKLFARVGGAVNNKRRNEVFVVKPQMVVFAGKRSSIKGQLSSYQKREKINLLTFSDFEIHASIPTQIFAQTSFLTCGCGQGLVASDELPHG